MPSELTAAVADRHEFDVAPASNLGGTVIEADDLGLSQAGSGPARRAVCADRVGAFTPVADDVRLILIPEPVEHAERVT